MEGNEAPVVIDVRDVKKKFRVYRDRGGTLKERTLFSARRKREDHWVLKDLSFQVRRGEAVGLIGENGCGKSTTLKLLTKILFPDEGTITMTGRVSSLIELGAGFHPDLSGRENIYTNASIFGLKRKEIDRRLKEIIAFSELEEFIDEPVRTYSSGMYMRLAFAVAINVDADILLIDEILAVGDAAFQAKCFRKLKQIKAAGTTIVIVSHSMGQIEQICDRSIWLAGGVIRREGTPRDVHPYYMKWMSHKGQDGQAELPGAPEEEGGLNRWGSGEARMTAVEVLDEEGNRRREFSPREAITIRIDYEAERELDDAVAGVAIYRSDGTLIYGTNTLIDMSRPLELKKQGRIELKADSFPAANGKYTIDLALHRPDGFNYDFWREICTILIADGLQSAGDISLPHSWEIH